MDYPTFSTYNALGGIFWCILLIGAGYTLGNILPKSGNVLTIVIFAIIVVSLIPVANEAYREWEKRKIEIIHFSPIVPLISTLKTAS